MGKSVAFLISGFGVGLGVALLAAPRAGAETRSRINSKLAEGQERLTKQAQNVRETVNDTIRRGTEMANRSTAAARSAVQAGLNAGKQEFRKNFATV